MKKYEKYKEVGLPWLKEVPEGWGVKPNKVFLKYQKNVVGKKADSYELLSLTKLGIRIKGDNDFSGKMPDNFENYQIVEKGQLVMCLFDLDISAVFSGLSNYTGKITSAYDVFNIYGANHRFADYYFRYIFQDRKYKLYSKSVRYTITKDDFRNLKTPIPPLHEQEHIANFLDWKISEIDKLINLEKAKQERLDELEEKTIEYYLFTGVNKNCSMKAIESSYMKEVPKLWDLCKISQLFKIQKRIANQLGFDVLSITQSGIKIKDISKNEGQMASDYSKYQIVEVGDFAMNHMDLITGYIDISKHRGVTSPDYRVFTVNSDDIVPEYYLYMFQLFYKKRVFYKYGRGAANQGRWRLPAKEFLNLYVPLPSKIEQKEIVKKIEEKVNQIDSLRTKIEIQGSYLEELKQTLISDAITGKIDVRNIKIPDYTHGKEEA